MEDLLITSKHSKITIDVLTNKNYSKIKGTGPISYHRGCDFGHDDDGTLYFSSKKAHRDND